jgi:hypothetical protein
MRTNLRAASVSPWLALGPATLEVLYRDLCAQSLRRSQPALVQARANRPKQVLPCRSGAVKAGAGDGPHHAHVRRLPAQQHHVL